MAKILWDFAGIEALTVAQTLFGESVGELAAFQSLETSLEGKDCSVLRLCDRNFRILYLDDVRPVISSLNCNVFVRQYTWLASFSIPADRLEALTINATVRAPHRLANLPNHQAVPAQLEDMSMLVWQHSSSKIPTIDIHTAHSYENRLKAEINRL
ncbi:MAG: hypothetical protein AAFP20_16525 [Cyanobacteria bacterium J06614_10]